MKFMLVLTALIYSNFSHSNGNIHKLLISQKTKKTIILASISPLANNLANYLPENAEFHFEQFETIRCDAIDFIADHRTPSANLKNSIAAIKLHLPQFKDLSDVQIANLIISVVA